MTQTPGQPRKAAIAFILVTLFIDILGIGIVIPVLPLLVKELVGGDVAVIGDAVIGDAVIGDAVIGDAVPGAGLEAAGTEAAGTEAAGTEAAGTEAAGTEVAIADDAALAVPKANGFARASLYYGVVGASYALMQFLFAPIVGGLSDQFGRRPVILISLFLLGIDFIIQGLAPNIWWLFGGRLLAGIFGASFSSANAYIADVSTDDTRARNFGFVGMMFGLGFTIGPALGGLLSAHSLRLPFFVAAGLALVNWCYGYFVLPESLPPEKRSKFTLAQANPLGTIKQLRAYPIVAGLAIVFICKSLAQRGLENVWVLYTSYRYGWDSFANGLALGLVGVTAIIVQGGLVRPIIKRISERKAVIYCSVIGSIAFLGYGLATEGWMIPIVICFGAISGVAGPAIQSLVTGNVDETEQGKIQGALTSLMSLTNVFAPLLFNTVLFSYFISERAPIKLPGAPFFVGSVLIAASVFVSIRVFQRFPAASAAAVEDEQEDDS